MFKDTIRENGVDLHLAPQILEPKNSSIPYDPRVEENSNSWFDLNEKNSFVIQPNKKVLCRTVEYLKMPDDLIGFCYLRSSYSRMGLYIPPTIVDAGFEGTLAIAIRGSSLPVKLYMEDRFMHLVISKEASYSGVKYKGKYYRQVDVTSGISDKVIKNGSL